MIGITGSYRKQDTKMYQLCRHLVFVTEMET
nr:MAG TPA: hypothetical protein [Caudoviricetes sp.]